MAIDLTKRIPLGAGLGGGSSNAVAVLRGLNLMHGEPLSPEQLAATAATLGSDCPLFLAGSGCIMRGRGERISPLGRAARQRFSGIRVLLFKPDFGIGTAWAYAMLAATRGAYADADNVEEKLAAWLAGDAPVAELLGNSFEPVVHRKFLALAEVSDRVRREPGVTGVMLSGSGSASFALLEADLDPGALVGKLRETLGADVFVQETDLG